MRIQWSEHTHLKVRVLEIYVMRALFYFFMWGPFQIIPLISYTWTLYSHSQCSLLTMLYRAAGSPTRVGSTAASTGRARSLLTMLYNKCSCFTSSDDRPGNPTDQHGQVLAHLLQHAGQRRQRRELRALLHGSVPQRRPQPHVLQQVRAGHRHWRAPGHVVRDNHFLQERQMFRWGGKNDK